MAGGSGPLDPTGQHRTWQQSREAPTACNSELSYWICEKQRHGWGGPVPWPPEPVATKDCRQKWLTNNRDKSKQLINKYNNNNWLMGGVERCEASWRASWCLGLSSQLVQSRQSPLVFDKLLLEMSLRSMEDHVGHVPHAALLHYAAAAQQHRSQPATDGPARRTESRPSCCTQR